MRKLIKSIPSLRRAYYRRKMRTPQGQSDETSIVERLAEHSEKTFVEFGFHPTEFNCASLARKPDWKGLLLDGDSIQVEDARHLLAPNIETVQRFITLENIGLIASHFRKIGVLSIDVDGNDYWFLDALLATNPDVIAVEYNASFGIDPITIPYDPSHDRHAKHPNGWYHGASLTALANLCARSGYGLAAVSDNGCNAFFTKDGDLDPVVEWKPNSYRASHSGIPHDQQWHSLKHLPFVKV
jgi:hypothetical protein